MEWLIGTRFIISKLVNFQDEISIKNVQEIQLLLQFELLGIWIDCGKKFVYFGREIICLWNDCASKCFPFFPFLVENFEHHRIITKVFNHF